MTDTQKGNMTYGDPLRLMVRFSLPMLIGGIFTLMYNMVDTVVLGNYVGVNALASIGITGTVVFGIVQSGLSIMNAISVVASQSFGSGDTARLKRAVGNSVWLVLISGVLLGAVGLFGARPLMRLIGTPDDIIDGAVLYLNIVCGLVIVQLIYNAVASLLRAIGDSRTPLMFLIICSVLNVALDLLFVLVFDMEIAGVAIATIISQAISAVISVIYMLRKYELLRFSREDMRPDREIISQTMRIGLPMVLQTIMLAGGQMVISSVINSFGSGTVAAYTIGSRVEQLATVLFSQFAFSYSVFSGQNFGARRFDRIYDGLKRMLLLIIGLSVISTLMMFLFGRQVSLFFVESNTPESVLSSAYNMIRIEASMYSFLGAIWLYNSALRGIGDSRFTLYSSIVELFSKMGLSLLLSHIFGETGIWFASPIGWGLGLVVSAVRFHSGRWERHAKAESAHVQ